MTKFQTAIKNATALVYESRRDRDSDPDGIFDSVGRWYPSDEEDADDLTCRVRSPSRAWPYSYMIACRTRKHVRALAAVVPDYVLRTAHDARAFMLDDPAGYAAILAEAEAISERIAAEATAARKAWAEAEAKARAEREAARAAERKRIADAKEEARQREALADLALIEVGLAEAT